MTSNHSIGDVVFVLCRHRHWGTPSLVKTTVNGIVVNEYGENLRFASFDDTDIVVEVFAEDQEREARVALADAITFHKSDRQRAAR